MNGNVLLDTNVVVALFAGDRVVKRRRNKAERVFVPAVVIGELFYGAFHSGQVRKNVAQVEAFAATSAVLECTTETARWYGQVKNGLQRKGRPLPDNDIWIAALAFQHELTLVTRDKHFQEVENLPVEIW